jgi:hypothetical protein
VHDVQPSDRTSRNRSSILLDFTRFFKLFALRPPVLKPTIL